MSLTYWRQYAVRLNFKGNIMKYLSDYTKQNITDLLKKYNGFFAFGQKQFDEQKKEGMKYVSRGSGLIHEAGKTKDFDKEFSNIIKEARKQDLKENGKEGIIKRELSNHECYYTGDIEQACDALKDYNINDEEVLKIFNKTNN